MSYIIYRTGREVPGLINPTERRKTMSKKVTKVTKATKAKAAKATESINNYSMEEAMENQNEIAEVVVEEPTLPSVQEEEPKTPKAKKPRAARTYKISLGRLPESSQKPLGLHAVVITEAIADLIAEGKETATREEIMAKAVDLGLYDRKPSRQGVVPIFSWWRKPLASLGWLDQGEENRVEVSTEEDLPL
jgi:hypothetical protein